MSFIPTHQSHIQVFVYPLTNKNSTDKTIFMYVLHKDQTHSQKKEHNLKIIFSQNVDP